MKQQTNKKRKETEEQKKSSDLVFKKRLVKKLVNQYINLYIIKEVVSTNVIKLRLLRIHLVVNVSQVVRLLDIVHIPFI